MTPKPFVLTVTLLAMFPMGALQSAVAQAQTDEGDKPAPTTRTADGDRKAVVREDHPRVVRTAPAAAAPARVAQPARADAPQQGAAQAKPRNDGGRDRGGNPQTGRAVPREVRPAPVPRRGGNIYVAPPIRSYYYAPRRYYPYGYGAFGLGYFYYDPYTWYPPPGYYSGYYPEPYGGGYYDVGELRIDVSPRSGDVYVDGYFAGRVDDYDGVFQALKLDAGAHHIQIVAPGFAPLDFDVRIDPGRKITYRGSLQPVRP